MTATWIKSHDKCNRTELTMYTRAAISVPVPISGPDPRTSDNTAASGKRIKGGGGLAAVQSARRRRARGQVSIRKDASSKTVPISVPKSKIKYHMQAVPVSVPISGRNLR